LQIYRFAIFGRADRSLVIENFAQWIWLEANEAGIR